MSDHVYKIVEIVGSSPTSIEDAVQTPSPAPRRRSAGSAGSRSSAPAAMSRTARSPTIQVTLRIGFTLEP